MNMLIENNLSRIRELCTSHKVKALFVFGSATNDSFNDASDIDLLVSFEPMEHGDYADSYFSLADQLEKVFQRPVDLVTENSLSNPYFIRTLEKTKKLIYG